MKSQYITLVITQLSWACENQWLNKMENTNVQQSVLLSITRCHALWSHLGVDLTLYKVVGALLPHSRPIPSYQGEGLVTLRFQVWYWSIHDQYHLFNIYRELWGLVVRTLAVQASSPGFSDYQSFYFPLFCHVPSNMHYCLDDSLSSGNGMASINRLSWFTCVLWEKWLAHYPSLVSRLLPMQKNFMHGEEPGYEVNT